MANEIVNYEGKPLAEVIKKGAERASIQAFLELSCPGIVYNPDKAVMPQLKGWLEVRFPDKAKDKKWIKAEAERKMRKEFRPYTDAVVAHIQREYDLELPKFNKPTKTGLVNGGNIPFKRKTSQPITQAEINAKLASGDADFLAALARAGYDVEKQEDKPGVREVEAALE